MSQQEQSAVERLYPYNVLADLQAARLDPQSSTAWSSLANSATFASAPNIADLALWKAIQLNPDDMENYDWGLQIYQPKWFNDRERLLKIVSLIAASPKRMFYLSESVYRALDDSGLQTEARQMMQRVFSELETAVQQNPRNAQAWQDLAFLRRNRGQYAESATAFEKWLELEPDNSIALVNYANMCERHTHEYKRMKQLFEHAIKVDPFSALTYYNYGLYYKDVERNFDKAAPLFRKAMTIDGSDTLSVLGLANIYWFLKNDGPTAEKLFKEAIRRNPQSGYAHSEYAWALMRHNRRAEAVRHAKRAIALGENDHLVFQALGMTP